MLISHLSLLTMVYFQAAVDGQVDIEQNSAKNTPAETVKIDQIGNISQAPISKQIGPQQKYKEQTNVAQLPGDIEILDEDGEGPEKQIVRPAISPEARLFSQVAEVWQLIRQRGQQPSPELIAREIGPDALTAFLDQNPGAESIFGQDSDQLPLDQPAELSLPDGSAIILPPTSGSGQ